MYDATELAGALEQREENASLYTFRPIHYLGSKLRFVPEILSAMDALDPSMGAVCDLFSGSGTVAIAASRLRPVVTVDIQEYSRILCSAILTHRPDIPGAQTLREAVLDSRLRNTLKAACAPLLRLESRALAEAVTGNLVTMRSILEDASIVAAQAGEWPRSSEARRAVEETLRNLTANGLDRGVEAVCTRHFGGAFFSFSQAIELDVLAQWARHMETDVPLAALLSAASELVNSVGKQFAQPLRLTDKEGNLKPHLASKIVRERSIAALDVYLAFLSTYRSLPVPSAQHSFIRADYGDALDRLGEEVRIVYADPPYTRDHYSRFYHVLETLALGDEPEIDQSNLGSQMSRGFYRTDRHQSDFCIKSRAPGAFRKLFGLCGSKNKPLLLSYSAFDEEKGGRPRLLSVGDLLEIARSVYPVVEVRHLAGGEHSKLTSVAINKGAGTTQEILLSCAFS